MCVFLCLCVCLCQHSSKLHMLPFSRGHCLCNKLILAHLTNCSSYCFCFRLIEFHLIYGAYNHAYCVQTINVSIELATRNKTNSRKKLLGTQTCGTKFVTVEDLKLHIKFSMTPLLTVIFFYSISILSFITASQLYGDEYNPVIYCVNIFGFRMCYVPGSCVNA